MKKVFVSGAFSVVHAGHIRFLRDARALGDYLIVSFPSTDMLWRIYGRKSILRDEDKMELLGSLDMVDEVRFSTDEDEAVSFGSIFRELRPDVLAVTTDDRYMKSKKKLCAEVGAEFVVLEKTAPEKVQITSGTEVLARAKAPTHVPLRVDFAGGWLDVPNNAREGEYVVNCAISPTVSLQEWEYRQGGGLGGSGAWSVLNGWDPVRSELGLGVGWQDPAVIAETGCCVWKSGRYPVLEFKNTGEFLKGKLAVYDTRIRHDTPGVAGLTRDMDTIARAGRVARLGVLQQEVMVLSEAVQMSYRVQLDEGMQPLPKIANELAFKYCGGGHGGYAVYLFATPEDRQQALDACRDLYPVEPYCRTFGRDEPVPWDPFYLQRMRESLQKENA